MAGRSFRFAWHYLEPVPADRLDRLFHHVGSERFGRSDLLENPPVRRRQVCHCRPVDYLVRLLCRHHVRVAAFQPSGIGHRFRRAE